MTTLAGFSSSTKGLANDFVANIISSGKKIGSLLGALFSLPLSLTSMKYEKLVRDKIPQILDKKGILYKKRKANDKEYKLELIKKLKEEVEEFIVQGSVVFAIIGMIFALVG
jgi:hypothetical protein